MEPTTTRHYRRLKLEMTLSFLQFLKNSFKKLMFLSALPSMNKMKWLSNLEIENMLVDMMTSTAPHTKELCQGSKWVSIYRISWCDSSACKLSGKIVMTFTELPLLVLYRYHFQIVSIAIFLKLERSRCLRSMLVYLLGQTWWTDNGLHLLSNYLHNPWVCWQ